MIIERSHINRAILDGRVAVVTGSGQGIGRETARVLAYLGAAVVVAEIRDTGFETEQLIRDEGGRALFVRTDVSDPSSMEHLRVQTLQAFGEADILVNNAAFYATRPLLDLSVEEWDRVFSVNLRGAFLGIKGFLPTMLKRRQGVVMMESAEGMPYIAPYLASKVGLRSLAMSLAQEIGEESGVSVYCFGPGMAAENGQDPKSLIGPGKLAAYVSQLKRMADFITRQESEARGWIRDTEKLRIALKALDSRKETVCKLAEALTAMQGMD